MILIPITLLALAAGVYLLVYIKQAGLGGLYKYMAWLVVVLSLLFIVCTVVREARYQRCCHAQSQCRMGSHEGSEACPYMKGGDCKMEGGHGECTKGAEGCSKDGGEGKACCKKGAEEGKAPCCKKDGEEGKAACCTKGADAAKPACCAKGGTKAAADSTAKK